jgi:hypothetical protein
MREIDYLRSLRDDGAALATAAGRGLDPPVPACEGWTVADLVLHTGMVHRHKLEIVRGRLAEPPDPWPPPAPARAELLEVFLSPHSDGEPVGGRGESLHLHATDTEGEWRLRLLPAGVEVGQGHAQADATAAGAASDLLLFLWGRAGAGPLERSGDPALLPRVRELAAAATQ